MFADIWNDRDSGGTTGRIARLEARIRLMEWIAGLALALAIMK
jgi:hypothetical protein